MSSIYKENIALICGAGSVKNSWLPIKRAFKSNLSNYEFDDIHEETINSFFSQLIYLLRWAYIMKKEGINNVDMVEEYHTKLNKVRALICTGLNNAIDNGELKVQDDFLKIISHLQLDKCQNLMVISTNWDDVLEKALNELDFVESKFGKIKSAKIHGSYLDSSNLYLPNEIINEPYRTEDEKNYLGVLHNVVFESLEKATRIVLYGISLSPLDAELLTFLNAAFFSENLKKVTIVNTNPELVAQKVRLLIGSSVEIQLEQIDPRNL